ncbi:MAG: SRPBCC family protein [Microthrixaceae bacterium]
MSTISASHQIDASPEAVWAIATSMDRWVDVVEAIERVERLDDGTEFGLGTTWRETRTMFGKQATECMEVTEYVDGERYATFAESHGSKYYSEISVEPSEGGCLLSMNFRGVPQTALTKIMDVTIGRLFMGATRKALAKDLADIGAAAEAASA